MAALSWVEPSINVGDALSLLVLASGAEDRYLIEAITCRRATGIAAKQRDPSSAGVHGRRPGLAAFLIFTMIATCASVSAAVKGARERLSPRS